MRSPRVWIGIAVSVLSLALLLRGAHLASVASEIAAVGARWPWLLLAVLVEFGSLWIRGIRWRVIVGRWAQLSTAESFSLLVIGYAANDLLPMRAGEVVRAQLLHESHGTSRLAGLGTILVERIFDALILATFLACTVFLTHGISGHARLIAFVVLAASAGATLCIAVLAFLPALGEWGVGLAVGLAPAGARPRAREWLLNFLGGFSALQTARAWALVIGTSLATWLVEATAFWLVGEAFRLALAPQIYLAVDGAATLAIAAPSTAGGVGPFELSAGVTLGAFGVHGDAAAAYALVMHALLIVPVVVLGLFLLWRQHLGLGSMMRAAQTAPAAEGLVE